MEDVARDIARNWYWTRVMLSILVGVVLTIPLRNYCFMLLRKAKDPDESRDWFAYGFWFGLLVALISVLVFCLFLTPAHAKTVNIYNAAGLMIHVSDEFDLDVPEQTFSQMMESSGLAWWEYNIYEETFPIRKSDFGHKKARIMYSNTTFNEREVTARFAAIGLRPASLQEELAFVKKYSRQQKDVQLIAIGQKYDEVKIFWVPRIRTSEKGTHCLDLVDMKLLEQIYNAEYLGVSAR